STSASASIRRAAALFFSPLAALRSSQAVRSSRVMNTAAPIDAAPFKSQHRVRVSLIWESLMSHSFGPLVLEPARCEGQHHRPADDEGLNVWHFIDRVEQSENFAASERRHASSSTSSKSSTVRNMEADDGHAQ